MVIADNDPAYEVCICEIHDPGEGQRLNLGMAESNSRRRYWERDMLRRARHREQCGVWDGVG